VHQSPQRRRRWQPAATLSSTAAPRDGRSDASSRCFIWRNFVSTLRSNLAGSEASGEASGAALASTTAFTSVSRAEASRSLKKRWQPRQSTCAVPVDHLVERRHEDACAGREHDLVVAGRAPAALLVHQLRNQIGARRGRELLAAILCALRARRRVGSNLH